MGVILGILFVLAVITLVGHGIWAFLAWLFRLAGSGSPRPIPAEMCPRCGAVWDRRNGLNLCAVCDWPAKLGGPRGSSDSWQLLHYLEKRVERYQQLGLISGDRRDRLVQALRVDPRPTPAMSPVVLEERPAAAPLPASEITFVDSAGPVLEPVGEASGALPLAPADEVASRMHAYRESRATSVVPDRSTDAVKALPPKPSERMFTILSAFLEQKNIRWGEIVGGLLIVGCSLALVLSFWSSIAERPLLKFGLFTGVTALLFGLGFHAERRWNLPTTALGLLIIATLLIPLNFLAVASLGRGAVVESAGGLIGEVVTVGLFAALTTLAGRSLVTRAPNALALGVLVPSTTMLLIRRFVDPAGGLPAFLALGAVPLLGQGASVAALIARARREPEFDEDLALDLLRLLGLTTFAVALSLGLLIAQGGPLGPTLNRAALLAPMAGAPALATGLLIWRRTVAADLVGYRTSGTAIAAAGTFLMLSGVAFTWPGPPGVIAVALIDCAVLSLVAFAFEVPAAHVLAGACLTLAYLFGWHLAAGTLTWTVSASDVAMRALLSSRSGTALVPLFLFFGGASAAALRYGRRLDAQAYAMVAALAALTSLGLASWFGFGRPGDPAGLTWVYAVHAIAALSAAAWFGRHPIVDRTDGRVEARSLGWAGSALFLATFVQALVFGGWIPGLGLPWSVALLAHATLAAALAAIIAYFEKDRWPTGTLLHELLATSAVVSSLLAALTLAFAVPAASSSRLAADLTWLALVWLTLSWRFASPTLFAACQLAASGAAVFATATLLDRLGWWSPGGPDRWLDPRNVRPQAVVQALLCLGWIGMRLAIRRRASGRAEVARALIDPPWPSFDRCLRPALLLVLVVLATYGAWPGVVRELGTSAPSGSSTAASSGLVDAWPSHDSGPGSWALLGLLLVVLLVGQWERFRPLDLIGGLLVGSMAVPLAARHWDGDVATASALRWASAAFLLLASAPIWGRNRLSEVARRLGWRFEPEEVRGLDRLATGTVFALTLLPLLVVTISVAGRALTGTPIRGPEPGSSFARLGGAGSYVPPLLLAAATLLGHAFRERASSFAFAAALLLNLAAASGYVLAAGGAGPVLDGAFWVRFALLEAIVSSSTALIWIDSWAAWRRGMREEGPLPADPLLAATLVMGLSFDVLVLIAGTAMLFLDPRPGGANLAIAGPWGWAAMLVGAASVVSWARRSRRPVAPDGLAFGVLCVADFLALGLALRDPGDWRTYHGVMAGQTLAGMLLLLAAWRSSGFRLDDLSEDRRTAVARWSTFVLGVVVLFALGAYWSDPQSPWWTVAGLSCMAIMAATLAVWGRRPSFLAVAGVLLNLAVTSWSYATHFLPAPTFESDLVNLLNLNVIALALPAPAWLWIDARFLRPGPTRELPTTARGGRVPFQRVAAWVALSSLALVVVSGLASDASEGGIRPSAILGWGALASSAIAMAAGLWDDRSRASTAGLYLLGLIAAGWSVHQYHLPAGTLAWVGTVILSAYSLSTSYLWSRRDALRSFADRLRIPRPDADDPIAGLSWLAPANLALAAGVLVLAFGTIVTEPEVSRRSMAAHAALAEVLATGLLARGERRLRLQLVALGVGVVGAVAWGWAWIEPGSTTGAFDRMVVVLLALVAASGLYGLGLSKLLRRENDWTAAAVRLVPGLLVLGALVLALLLGAEVFEKNEGREIAMSVPALAALAASIAVAAASALIAAVVPGRDPLGLSERGRTAYVYGAEVLLALLMLHVRLTLPWLFSGFFARYRPFVVLSVAFLGVGLGELFRRQGRLVLSDPLERTGALLPLLPLLGAYWVEPRPGEDTLFLALAGVLYTMISLLRSSIGFGALAALAYNGALWVMLGRHEGLGFLDHPQLWVIPPALCVLIGAYLNRDRLSEAQLTSIRYATCLAIYLSSTGDIVMNGVAQAPWLPLVLGGLSIAGIFAGIVLRVRGFFFLGLGFLVLSLFTIIWHAAVDLHQTWLWSASGIVAGILILALFALFEKKRQEVLQLVDQLKEWNA